MSGYLKLTLAVYWLGLAAWLAALGGSALAAVGVFGSLPGMAIALDRFEAYPRQEHGSLAAGLVMADVFFAADVVQFVAAPLAVLTLALQLTVYGHVMQLRRPAHAIRAAALAAAALLFAFHAAVVAPGLNAAVRDYWEAAAAGDAARAAGHRDALRGRHATAELVLQVNLGLLVTAVIASAAAFAPVPRTALERPRLASPP